MQKENEKASKQTNAPNTKPRTTLGLVCFFQGAASDTGAGSAGSAPQSSSKSPGPSPDTLEALISVNHKLGLDMAAAGLLRQAEQRATAGLCELVVRPSWLEKLSRWGECGPLACCAWSYCFFGLWSGLVGFSRPKVLLHFLPTGLIMAISCFRPRGLIGALVSLFPRCWACLASGFYRVLVFDELSTRFFFFPQLRRFLGKYSKGGGCSVPCTLAAPDG